MNYMMSKNEFSSVRLMSLLEFNKHFHPGDVFLVEGDAIVFTKNGPNLLSKIIIPIEEESQLPVPHREEEPA